MGWRSLKGATSGLAITHLEYSDGARSAGWSVDGTCSHLYRTYKCLQCEVSRL